MEAVGRGVCPESGYEQLDAATRGFEALELLLRTREGVPVGALDLTDPDLAGLVVTRDDRVVLTLAGRLLANEVALRLRPDAATQ